MSELYTSAVHLKALLAGQATPAFTPAPEAVLKMLDPAFFPGLGALNEDDLGRLQCPVRGCGQWYRELARHLSQRHSASGGAAGIRAALSISKTTPLVSSSRRRHHGATPSQLKQLAAIRPLAAVAKKPWKRSAMADNIDDRCPAQTAHKVAALGRKLGHSPTEAEFRAEYGAAISAAVRKHFATWANVRAACGLSAPKVTRKPKMDVARVLTSLETWRDVNGRLPTALEVQKRERIPWLPAYPTILSALGVATWGAAMRSTEARLRKAS